MVAQLWHSRRRRKAFLWVLIYYLVYGTFYMNVEHHATHPDLALVFDLTPFAELRALAHKTAQSVAIDVKGRRLAGRTEFTTSKTFIFASTIGVTQPKNLDRFVGLDATLRTHPVALQVTTERYAQGANAFNWQAQMYLTPQVDLGWKSESAVGAGPQLTFTDTTRHISAWVHEASAPGKPNNYMAGVEVKFH